MRCVSYGRKKLAPTWSVPGRSDKTAQFGALGAFGALGLCRACIGGRRAGLYQTEVSKASLNA